MSVRSRKHWSAGVAAAGAAAAAVLCLVGPALGQPGPRDDWIRLSTANFELLTDGPERKAWQIAEGLEQLRQIIAFIGTDVEAIRRTPITFVVFKNEGSFEPYMRTPPGRDTVRSWEGFYGEGRDYLLLNGSRPPKDVLPWAYDAYASYLIDIRYRDYPYWLRRGLGEFYGSSEVDARRKVRIGIPQGDHVRTLRQRSMIPLEQLFRIDSTAAFLDHPESLRVFNAQTWALAHFLMTGGGREGTGGGAFFRALGRGAAPEEAIRTVFGTDLDGFEKLVSAYVRQPSLPLFTLDGDFLTESAIEATPLDTLEISYQLGYYLVVAHDPPPIALAEAHLEPVVAAEGERHDDALAVLAELRHRTGRQDEAATLFADALAGEPHDASSYYLAASFLTESEGATATAIHYLERAVEIEPGYGEAWAALGELYADDGLRSGEAVPALERAIELLPNRPDLPYNLAMLHLRDGRVEAARALVEQHLRAEPRYLEPALEAIRRQELVDTSQRAATTGDIDSAIESYEKALAEATDPAMRAQLRTQLQRLESSKRTQQHTDTYNHAVEIANQGHYREALEILEELLPQIEDVSLKTATTTMIAQLRGLVRE